MTRPVQAPASLPGEEELRAGRAKLQRMDRILSWIGRERGWTAESLRSLGVGWGNPGLPIRGQRFVLPMFDAHGRLVNVRGYMPTSTMKMVGLRGRPVDLWPCPERTWPPGGEIWLVEGEPDAIAGRCVWPTVGTIAVPGSQTWKREWAARLARYSTIHVCFDADQAGDLLAERAMHDLAAAGANAIHHTWQDLTGRDVPKGYDLSDWARENPHVSLPPTATCPG